MLKFLVWCILLVICWPLALLAPYEDRRVVILDVFTSALDSEAEGRVLRKRSAAPRGPDCDPHSAPPGNRPEDGS